MSTLFSLYYSFLFGKTSYIYFLSSKHLLLFQMYRPGLNSSGVASWNRVPSSGEFIHHGVHTEEALRGVDPCFKQPQPLYRSAIDFSRSGIDTSVSRSGPVAPFIIPNHMLVRKGADGVRRIQISAAYLVSISILS